MNKIFSSLLVIAFIIIGCSTDGIDGAENQDNNSLIDSVLIDTTFNDTTVIDTIFNDTIIIDTVVIDTIGLDTIYNDTLTRN